MSDLTVGVLALQGDVREHLRVLAECDALARPVRRPEELDSVDALVIPGGESTTMSRLAVDFGVLEPIRKRIAEGMPAFGSCAGMIMLATQVLDGRPDQQSFDGIDMTVRRNAFGRQVDSFEASVELSGVPGGPVHAVFIRAPWVERVGDDVEILGSVPRNAGHPVGHVPGAAARAAGDLPGAAGHSPDDGRSVGRDPGGDAAPRDVGRIVAVRQRNLLATAFHPEITGDLRVHRYFLDMAAAAQKTEG